MNEIAKHVEPSEVLDKIASQIVDSAYTVHLKKGPGLLERIYRDCLLIELRKRGLKVEREVHVPVYYDDILLDGDYILDLIVENQIVVELKTVEQLSDLHRSQLKTYLDISGCHLGFLINFNCILETFA
ncbi:MAG: GxxExxY protein [Methanocella sp.]